VQDGGIALSLRLPAGITADTERMGSFRSAVCPLCHHNGRVEDVAKQWLCDPSQGHLPDDYDSGATWRCELAYNSPQEMELMIQRDFQNSDSAPP
jgi:hypothetical protein